MSMHCVSLVLFLIGWGPIVSKAAPGSVSLTPFESAGVSSGAAAESEAEIPARDKRPHVQRRAGATEKSVPLSPVVPLQDEPLLEESSEEERAHEEYNVVRGHLHVDLSLANNVDLLARLAPLMQRLIAEQEIFLSVDSATTASGVAQYSHVPTDIKETHSDGSAPPAKTAAVAHPRGARPNIQLELSYHIFDMEGDPASAPHCVTGDLGRFCAFPPDGEPSSIGEGQQEQVGGRAVAEEELLQLCLAEAERDNWFPEASAASTEAVGSSGGESTAETIVRHPSSAVSREIAHASRQSHTPLPSRHPDSRRRQHLKLLWDYLARWCCHCTANKLACNSQEGAAAAPGHYASQAIYPEDIDAKNAMSPFQAACSRAQVEHLNVPLQAFMKRCERAAADILQNQVDTRLSVVPALVINGKPAIGELTAESVLKTLCVVAEEQAAPTAQRLKTGNSPLPAVCRVPEILSSPTLSVKTYGMGTNVDFIKDMNSGKPVELEVAAHLLSSYERSPQGLATQSVARTQWGINAEGRYHFVNPKALRFLRKRLLARKRHKGKKGIPIVNSEEDSTAPPSEGGALAPASGPGYLSMTPVDRAEEALVADASGGFGADSANRGDSSSEGESLSTVEIGNEGASSVSLPLNAPAATLPSVRLPVNMSSAQDGQPSAREGSDGTSSQDRKKEAVGETSNSTSRQFAGIAEPAHLPPCAGETDTAPCTHPDDAAEATLIRRFLFNVDTKGWSLHFIVWFLFLLGAVIWYVKRKRSSAFVFPPRQGQDPAPHQAALLSDKLAPTSKTPYPRTERGTTVVY